MAEGLQAMLVSGLLNTFTAMLSVVIHRLAVPVDVRHETTLDETVHGRYLRVKSL